MPGPRRPGPRAPRRPRSPSAESAPAHLRLLQVLTTPRGLPGQIHSVPKPALQVLLSGSRTCLARSAASPRPLPHPPGKKRRGWTLPGAEKESATNFMYDTLRTFQRWFRRGVSWFQDLCTCTVVLLRDRGGRDWPRKIHAKFTCFRFSSSSSFPFRASSSASSSSGMFWNNIDASPALIAFWAISALRCGLSSSSHDGGRVGSRTSSAASARILSTVDSAPQEMHPHTCFMSP